jgi:hypothetical protein
LTSIHFNSTLEPNGLSRNDGKRPDGMTLVPRIKGQPLVWDVTIVDTLADNYVLNISEVSGFAAEIACKHKYSSIISSNYIFKGLAFETLGPWCKLQAFGALFQIPHYYRKFLYCKTKILCTYVIIIYTAFFISLNIQCKMAMFSSKMDKSIHLK